jgi:hypothetical protein
MTDAQLLVKAIIAAALIQSRAVDAEGIGSLNKDISHHKLTHLHELTDRIVAVLATDGQTEMGRP